MSSDRKLLESQLAELLSFDIEDTIDVIDHLLAFESEDDLLEHMYALLGEDNEDVKLFVSNVLKFQRGQGLDGTIVCEKDTTDSKPIEPTSQTAQREDSSNQISQSPMVSRKRQECIRLEKEKKEKRRQEEFEHKRQIEEERRQLEKLEKIRMKQLKALEELRRRQEEEDRKMQELVATPMTNATGDTSLTNKPCKKQSSVVATKMAKVSISEEEITKSHRPPRGKAKVICGCFGTIHKPLTNCLHCGRIACRKEGYGYCPHCSNLIEKTQTMIGSGKEFDKATLHKERLLKFDKEGASRTVVYDDQADYFQNSTSTWLTNEEQKDAGMKEEKRRRDLHTIKKHVLNIQF